MNLINKFYNNLNKDITKFSRTFVNIVTPYRNNHSVTNIKVYYQKNNSFHNDWRKIKGDYTKIGNDIKKAIKLYAR